MLKRDCAVMDSVLFNPGRIRKARAFLLLLVFILVSCSREDEKKYTWFHSLEEALTFNEQYVDNLISTASGLYPEIGSLRQYSSGGVTVYRMVYKTEVKGEPIKASGLVCLPAVPGSYPVLSFQNGTNTVNAYAPSNFAINTSFQLVEVMATMGYIVLIPDYPGFGASSSIPHPYLVAEPTVRSITDMFRALEEAGEEGLLPGATVDNNYYLMGYSQGGWATMALHKALETEYSGEFTLRGSACGAGPYDISFLFQSMTGGDTYPVPAYIGYIINAYSAYDQFTNPVSDILNEPYASRLSSLFNGNLDIGPINSQLTTSVSGLIRPEFLTGYNSLPKYSTVREAMIRNSVAPYKTLIPLYLVHGDSDSQVSPEVTDYFFSGMITAGTSPQVCTKEILPGLDHGEGAVPALVRGLVFLKNAASGN